MITKDQIETFINAYFNDSDKFLVEVKVNPANKIAAFIDGDQGITIDDCKELTRHIGSTLDRDQEDYDLTVSSAGADNPMKIPRQYIKHVGRELEITTTAGAIISGKLVAAGQESIELEHKPIKKEKQKPNTIVTFNQIKEGKVVLSFK
ncbi:MAG: ribosome assembly cofactor RimP [Bacteroidales bacterium]|nr:ribosome assembly cofactor RimP [Bacteroidales bacterium]